MDIARLKINHRGEPVPGFSGDEALFDKVAHAIGAALPEDYLKFIKIADGGHPEIGVIFLNDGIDDNSFDVNVFYSFSNSDHPCVQRAIDDWGRVLGKKILPIGEDGGSNQFYLDLNDKPASVWIYLHDEGGARVKLADSFTQFIEQLTSDPDFI